MSTPTTSMLSHGTAHDDREANKARDEQHASLREVKQDVAQLRPDVAECAIDAAHTGLDAVKSGAAQVIEAGNNAAATVQESHKKMCAFVSAHPTAAVLIAAGIGALLARVLPRG